jgi:hypothetical protein
MQKEQLPKRILREIAEKEQYCVTKTQLINFYAEQQDSKL